RMATQQSGGDAVALVVSARTDRVFPDQAAAIDIALKNTSPEPQTVLALELNHDWPVIQAFDARGTLLASAEPSRAAERLAGSHMGEPAPEPAHTLVLPPGGSVETWVNLWSLTDPFEPGRYAVAVQHKILVASPRTTTSARVAFRVEAARVAEAALGYESAVRQTTVLAWTAEPTDG